MSADMMVARSAHNSAVHSDETMDVWSAGGKVGMSGSGSDDRWAGYLEHSTGSSSVVMMDQPMDVLLVDKMVATKDCTTGGRSDRRMADRWDGSIVFAMGLRSAAMTGAWTAGG